MNNVLEHKKIRSRDGKNTHWYNKCECCGYGIDDGEIRHKWRLNIPTSQNYLRGQFWTTQCNECLLKTKEEWLRGLEALQV